MDKDILLKTTLMGFDKKTVMDFVENLQKENDALKRSVSALTTENANLREHLANLTAENNRLSKIAEYTSDSADEPFITYEDLSDAPYDMPYQSMNTITPMKDARMETVQRVTRKKSGVKAIKPAKKVRIPRK